MTDTGQEGPQERRAWAARRETGSHVARAREYLRVYGKGVRELGRGKSTADAELTLQCGLIEGSVDGDSTPLVDAFLHDVSALRPRANEFATALRALTNKIDLSVDAIVRGGLSDAFVPWFLARGAPREEAWVVEHLWPIVAGGIASYLCLNSVDLSKSLGVNFKDGDYYRRL